MTLLRSPSCADLASHKAASWSTTLISHLPRWNISSNGGFLKWWVSPTNPLLFLSKMIILGWRLGVPPFKETPKSSHKIHDLKKLKNPSWTKISRLGPKISSNDLGGFGSNQRGWNTCSGLKNSVPCRAICKLRGFGIHPRCNDIDHSDQGIFFSKIYWHLRFIANALGIFMT